MKGRTCPRCSPLGGEGARIVARILARVGASADELRFMDVEHAEVLTIMGSAGGGWISVARNDSNAKV